MLSQSVTLPRIPGWEIETFRVFFALAPNSQHPRLSVPIFRPKAREVTDPEVNMLAQGNQGNLPKASRKAVGQAELQQSRNLMLI